jgi:Dictyostelium (slime mold) repeat.
VRHRARVLQHGDLCTADTCQPLLGCIFVPDTDCDDGVSCTVDGCAPLLGTCTHDGTPCVPCTGGDPCDDGDPCTADSCGAGVCGHTPLSCDDGDLCTTDVCEAGACVHFGACDDGDACTKDACFEGVCLHDTTCDDGDACTTAVCDAPGTCAHVPTDCSDDDPCTVDTCFQELAGCLNAPLGCAPDGGTPCAPMACDPATGACAQVPIVCDDGDPCTVDACEGGACTTTPAAPGSGPPEVPNGRDDDCDSQVDECESGADCLGGAPCEQWSCDVTDGPVRGRRPVRRRGRLHGGLVRRRRVVPPCAHPM